MPHQLQSKYVRLPRVNYLQFLMNLFCGSCYSDGSERQPRNTWWIRATAFPSSSVAFSVSTTKKIISESEAAKYWRRRSSNRNGHGTENEEKTHLWPTSEKERYLRDVDACRVFCLSSSSGAVKCQVPVWFGQFGEISWYGGSWNSETWKLFTGLNWNVGHQVIT